MVNIIDIFMGSIEIPLYTEILFAVFSYAFSQCIDFFDKDENKES